MISEIRLSFASGRQNDGSASIPNNPGHLHYFQDIQAYDGRLQQPGLHQRIYIWGLNQCCIAVLYVRNYLLSINVVSKTTAAPIEHVKLLIQNRDEIIMVDCFS